jgi:chorismate mutase
MADWTEDPVVAGLRERISAADRELLALFNSRVRLVGELREHKERNGYPFVDVQREERLLGELSDLNAGPLSPEGVRELFCLLIELGKREAVAQRGARSPAVDTAKAP